MKNNLLPIFFFCFTLMPLSCMPSGLSCTRQFLRYQPCAFEILGLINLRQPISTSCCTTILEFAGSDCPPPLPYNLFVKGQDYCIKKTTPPPPPPPPPPSDDKKCPPSDGVSHPPADSSCDVKPCYKEMIYFYNQNCPISSSCCSLILKVVDKCPNMRWKLTTKSNDYCKKHQRSATPPTSRG